MADDRTVGALSEEEVLGAVFPLLGVGSEPAAVVVGAGDDAAVLRLRGDLVATTDSMLRGVDWRDDWSSPQDVGVKAVVQNVADVLAMGARPVGLLVALALDPATPLAWVTGLAEGIASALPEGCVVLGGDLSSAPPGVVVVAVTALGDLDGRAPVRRSGARPGDIVAVCGTLGRSGGGLAVLRGAGRGGATEEATELLVNAHRRPSGVGAAVGSRAAAAGAHTLVDISDGLVRDAGRVARASGVTLELARSVLEEVFVAGPLAEVLGEEAGLVQVLSGGEEHALLGCFPAGSHPADVDGWVVVGRVIAAGPQGPQVTLDGVVPDVVGWDHFAG